MKFNVHSHLWGKHAFLSASKYHWVNYDEELLIKRYETDQAAKKGTQLHELAAVLIEGRHKMARRKVALNQFVNDAIGFGMEPEVLLYYSDNCFGTADAIRFDEPTETNSGHLRIHDLKTGVTAVKMTQLEVYAAMFCLEYNQRPCDIDMTLRIYQGGDILEHIPESEVIDDIMFKIVEFDKVLNEYKAGELG